MTQKKNNYNDTDSKNFFCGGDKNFATVDASRDARKFFVELKGGERHEKIFDGGCCSIFPADDVAHAATVPIFDRSVDILLTDMKKLLSAANLPPIRGTRYYTGNDGFRYCELYFGSSNKNRLIFRLNDKGAVWSAGITYVGGKEQDLNAMSAGLLLSLILGEAGMSDAEGQRFVDKMTTWLNKSVAQNLNNATTTSSVWCANANRYFELKASIKDALSRNNGIATFFLSAHT